jgi:hypothetical protein
MVILNLVKDLLMNKKVQIECWWTSSKDITQRTLDQFSFNNNTSDIDFVTDNNYDWLVVCGKLPQNFNSTNINKSRTIFFVMEPSWSPNTDKDAANYSKYICTHNKNIFNDKSAIFFEEPNYMFYGGRGDSGWNIDTITKSIFNKTKNISCIVTKRGNSWGTKNIYDERVALADLLSIDDHIDIYGTFWPNNGKNIHGEIWNKFVALNDYMFSIGIENTSENNYITEKFYDCILTDTIPIYFGAPNISDYFDMNGMVYLDNIFDTNRCATKINNIYENIYNEYNSKIESCKKNKLTFLTNHNIINKIKEIIYNE